jgi:S1-C subfamily serine protease
MRMSAIQELQDAARAVAERVAAATVTIGRQGRGTGVVIGPGQVLTNAHNLRDRTTQVGFADGRAVQGEVVGRDVDGDLAVLRVDTGDVLPLEWAPEAPTAGSVVFAASRGGHRLRVTWGLVSSADLEFRGPRGRRIAGSVEHTAPLARGSSGGPLLDTEGRLVAVNTHRAGAGFYLARPADDALRARVAELAAGRSVTRRTLGVALAPAHVATRLRRAVGLPERDGLLIRGVEDGSPAARAGLVEGDLVVAVGDRPVTTVDGLLDALDGVGDGATLSLTVVRGTEERAVAVSFDPAATGGEDGTA